MSESYVFSTDEQHQATLDLLREVADYLERLPPVPVTRELCRKVRAHLDDPTHCLIERTEHARRTRRRGEAFTAAGLPLLAAELREQLVIDKRLGQAPREVLTKLVQITMRTKPKGLNVDREVLAALKRPTGVVIALDEQLSSDD